MKKLLIGLLILTILVTFTGCGRQADKASYNVSQEADRFNVLRRLTVLNARTDKPMFELIGVFSITVDNEDNQLEVIVETGEGEYKKHFVALNQWTMYIVEDIGQGSDVSNHRYEVNFLPEEIIPITITSKR